MQVPPEESHVVSLILQEYLTTPGKRTIGKTDTFVTDITEGESTPQELPLQRL